MGNARRRRAFGGVDCALLIFIINMSKTKKIILLFFLVVAAFVLAALFVAPQIFEVPSKNTKIKCEDILDMNVCDQTPYCLKKNIYCDNTKAEFDVGCLATVMPKYVCVPIN